MDVVEQARSLARLRRMVADGTVTQIRRDAGVTQKAMARQLRVHETTLIRWEQGSPPRPKAALAWLRLLDRLAAELEQDGPKERQ